MLELVMMIVAPGLVFRIAVANDQSGFLWAAIAILLSLVSAMVVPLPMLRVVFSTLTVLIAMMVAKAWVL